MIYFYFLGRQTGKTTKAIEIFNRDVDNMLMVHDSSTKQHLKEKILREALINPKHNYLLDRKIKTINQPVIGYRCKNLIIDEPLDSNLDFNNNTFLLKLYELDELVEKDIIILQSIEEPKVFEYIQITNRIIEIYKTTEKKRYIKEIEREKEINKITEEIYHKATMINILSEEIENELDSIDVFKNTIIKILENIPLYKECIIITNKLPE